jgi:hypothetical protein
MFYHHLHCSLLNFFVNILLLCQSFRKDSVGKVDEGRKKVYTTYFAEGAHSMDNTGEQSEADFPLYVQLFEDYFTWKASALPGRVREQDIQL